MHRLVRRRVLGSCCRSFLHCLLSRRYGDRSRSSSGFGAALAPAFLGRADLRLRPGRPRTLAVPSRWSRRLRGLRDACQLCALAALWHAEYSGGRRGTLPLALLEASRAVVASQPARRRPSSLPYPGLLARCGLRALVAVTAASCIVLGGSARLPRSNAATPLHLGFARSRLGAIVGGESAATCDCGCGCRPVDVDDQAVRIRQQKRRILRHVVHFQHHAGRSKSDTGPRESSSGNRPARRSSCPPVSKPAACQAGRRICGPDRAPAPPRISPPHPDRWPRACSRPLTNGGCRYTRRLSAASSASEYLRPSEGRSLALARHLRPSSWPWVGSAPPALPAPLGASWLCGYCLRNSSKCRAWPPLHRPRSSL